MKKCITILLLFIYSFSTLGMSLREVYCCGKLKSVQFVINTHAQHKCNKGDEKNGCCTSKFQNLKVKDDQLTASDILSLVKAHVALHSTAQNWQPSLNLNSQALVSYHNNAPPLHNGIPIYIFDCVYRI